MSRRKPLPENPFEVVIDSLAHDGRGVAHHEGKAIFVSGALEGERVSIRLKQRRRKFDIGQIEQVLTHSPDRVTPKCAHFGQCGGCSLQHMEPSAQLRAKEGILRENLQRIGKVQPKEWLQPLQADIWAYRGKARLGVRHVRKKERVLVGFREKGSSFITDTRRCEILIEAVGGRIETIADVISELSIRSAVPQIELAAGENNVCLIFRVLESPTEGDLEKLRELARELDCMVAIQPAGPGSVYALQPEQSTPLYYSLPEWGLKIFFQPQDFTQVNASLNRKMILQAIQHLDLQSNDTVLDLFCGLGNFSLPIAKTAKQVVGIEGEKDMVERADANAKENGLNNLQFQVADLFQPVDTGNAVWQNNRFEKVLLDPPRSGAEEVMHWLPRMAPSKIVYVSCNTSTLARDADILVNMAGYSLDKVGVMDMFPHTAHTEAMAVFSKKP